MKVKKLLLIIAGLLISVMSIIGFKLYNSIYKANTIKEGFLYIPVNSSFEEVENLIKPYLENAETFVWVANLKKYQNSIKSGKYKIVKGLNNNELVNLLRGGNQTVVKLSFNNQDTLEKLAGRISTQIEADSISLINAFRDEFFLEDSGFSKATSLAMYIPNTYHFNWDTSAKSFRDKMLVKYNNFWNESRIEKAKKQNLSPIEVITLASIIQKETANVSERPTVAGLYLNRLRDKWPLQADPTIKFAINQISDSDIIIKRILTRDLNIDSKYNTYKYAGLPPGPISMPDISSIDAVLDPANHDYYFMCASVTNIGSHEFAKTLSQHNKNAKKYQKRLSQQGVNR